MPSQKIDQPRKNLLQKSVQAIGTLITILALGFAIQRTWTAGHSNWDQLLRREVLAVTLAGGVFYGFLGFFLAWAWRNLLVWFGETANLKLCVIIYGRTQIAKYIPGNFFHIPNRHLAGNKAGFKHPALVGAALYEIIGIVIATGAITLFGFPAKIDFFGNSLIWPAIILALFALIPLIIQFLISYLKLSTKMGFPERSILGGYIHLLPIWLIYVLFSILAGVITWGIIGVTTGEWFLIPISLVLSTYAISWLAGFITPGAPAGIGVREASMILLLSGFIGEPASVLVAIISRLVVTLGDLGYFAFSHFYKLETEVAAIKIRHP